MESKSDLLKKVSASASQAATRTRTRTRTTINVVPPTINGKAIDNSYRFAEGDVITFGADTFEVVSITSNKDAKQASTYVVKVNGVVDEMLNNSVKLKKRLQIYEARNLSITHNVADFENFNLAQKRYRELTSKVVDDTNKALAKLAKWLCIDAVTVTDSICPALTEAAYNNAKEQAKLAKELAKQNTKDAKALASLSETAKNDIILTSIYQKNADNVENCKMVLKAMGFAFNAEVFTKITGKEYKG